MLTDTTVSPIPSLDPRSHVWFHGVDMRKRLIDADTILNRAKPLTHQHAHEIQPFGHLIRRADLLCQRDRHSGHDRVAKRIQLLTVLRATWPHIRISFELDCAATAAYCGRQSNPQTGHKPSGHTAHSPDALDRALLTIVR